MCSWLYGLLDCNTFDININFIFINEQFEHTLYKCPIIKDTFGNPLPLPTDLKFLG